MKTLANIVGAAEHVNDNAEVNLIVTNDNRMRSLNREYRNIDKTTDVLSFPLDPDGHSEIIGEVYISETRAMAQAQEYAHSVSAELLRLACHGLFHVLGYDHDTDETGDDMEERERASLATLAMQFRQKRKQ